MLRRSPAEVLIGREANGRTEVLAGLAPGGKVITSGQFLLDSEASLAGLEVRGIDEASAGASGGDTKQAQRQGPKEYSANGTIEEIAARTVTLRQGPLGGAGWPSLDARQVTGRGKRVSVQGVLCGCCSIIKKKQN